MWAAATRLEYYPSANNWSTPGPAGDTATKAETVNIWHNAGLQLGSVDSSRELPIALEEADVYMPAAGNGQWVWCLYDEGPGCWVVLQPFEDIIRVRFTQNFYACQSATAVLVLAPNDITLDTSFYTSAGLVVYDPLNTITYDIWASGQQRRMVHPRRHVRLRQTLRRRQCLGAAALHARRLHIQQLRRHQAPAVRHRRPVPAVRRHRPAARAPPAAAAPRGAAANCRPVPAADAPRGKRWSIATAIPRGNMYWFAEEEDEEGARG